VDILFYLVCRIRLLELDEDEEIGGNGAEHTGEGGQAYIKEAHGIQLWHQIQPANH